MGSRDATWQRPEDSQDSVTKKCSFHQENSDVHTVILKSATHSIRMDLCGTGSADLDRRTAQPSIPAARSARSDELVCRKLLH